jgi:hypothetical protein
MGEGLMGGGGGAEAIMHGDNGDMSGVTAAGEAAASPQEDTCLGVEIAAGLSEAVQEGVHKIIDIVKGEVVTPAGIRYTGPGTIQHIIRRMPGL